MVKNQIICLCETWQEEVKCDAIFKAYSSVHSAAHKNSGRGRPAGGISIFFMSNLFKLVKKCVHRNFIFVRLQTKDKFFTIISVYIQPGSKHAEKVNLLFDRYQEWRAEYPNDNMVIGGDFNAHIGQENQLITDLYGQIGSFNRIRHSKHKKVESKGRTLLEKCNEFELVIFNGRSVSDSLGEFTFSAFQGNSVVDYVMLDVDTCKHADDFKVMDFSHSSHFPVQVGIKQKDMNEVVGSYLKLKWDTLKLQEYTHSFLNAMKAQKAYSYADFINVLYTASKENGMFRYVNLGTPCFNVWWNGECRKARKRTGAMLKLVRREGWDAWGARYVEVRREYRELIARRKREYFKGIREGINNVRNPTQFWQLVRNFEKSQVGRLRLTKQPGRSFTRVCYLLENFWRLT